MRYFLSENLSNSYFTKALLRTGGTGSMLFSYASNKNPEAALKIIKQFDAFPNIIIDSGAFSVWNSGQTMNKADLIHFYNEIRKYRQDVIFINLDVIPGSKGIKPTKKQLQDACKEGWDNYLELKKLKFNVLPVFHEDDDWKYLEMMKKETDYIAISPANDSHVNERIKWLDGVYADLKADYKTHGLAATSQKLLERYPFYSVDSINWKVPLMFAHSKVAGKVETSILARSSTAKGQVLDKEIEYYVKLQENITRLWAKRGVVWA